MPECRNENFIDKFTLFAFTLKRIKMIYYKKAI